MAKMHNGPATLPATEDVVVVEGTVVTETPCDLIKTQITRDGKVKVWGFCDQTNPLDTDEKVYRDTAFVHPISLATLDAWIADATAARARLTWLMAHPGVLPRALDGGGFPDK